MKIRLSWTLAALALVGACTRTAPTPPGVSTSQAVPSSAAQRLPVLIATAAEAQRHAGQTVQLRGRSIASTWRGWATPALELAGGIVVLDSKSESGRAAILRALQGRPLGTRFALSGTLELLPPKEGAREFAAVTLGEPPSADIAATGDEISVAVWPASTATMAAAAPLVHIPLSGTPYAWWSLLLSDEGALHLEADGRGRQAIALDGPVAAVKEMLVVDADGDTLFELVLLIQTAAGRAQAMAVGAGGQRLPAVEARLGQAQTTQEIFRALGTFHWPAILAGPDGASVARVWWDEASLGAPPLHQLRIAGVRFSTSEEPLLRDLPPSQPLLRLRGEPDQIVVEARCGGVWRELGRRAAPVPGQAARLAEALRATRTAVDSRTAELPHLCTQ